MFSKVLVANRGEIAIRVFRALKELDIQSVAVYSELDREAPHVKQADEAFLIGPAAPAESYLNVEKILEVAKESGAEAVHPGYGFLAENAEFARACKKAGITFIGPPAEAIDAMGSKTKARELMAAADVPIVPGTTDPVETVEDARKIVDETIGYPVAVKAAGGGGGKGFRVALSEDKLEDAFEGAAREGEKFFSDATVYVERYLPNPRHVEVQVLADTQGNTIHLGERDCSIQRRHQKLIEEAPGPAVDTKLREKIGKIAVDAAKAVGYFSAGTVEGLLQDGEYYFLEMNTRVQVEHCVTEMVTGIDIVKEQIKVAAGEKLSITQKDVKLNGHAIECRINAENAAKNFAPAPGAITGYKEPSGPGVRVDSGVGPGSEVSPMYDPMVAKRKGLDVTIQQDGEWTELKPHMRVKKGSRLVVHDGGRLRGRAPRNGKRYRVGFDPAERIPADVVFQVVIGMKALNSSRAEVDAAMVKMEVQFLERRAASSPECDPKSAYRRFAGSSGVDTTALTQVLTAVGGVLQRSTPDHPRGLIVFEGYPQVTIDLHKMVDGRRVKAEEIRDLWEDILGREEAEFAAAMIVEGQVPRVCKKTVQ